MRRLCCVLSLCVPMVSFSATTAEVSRVRLQNMTSVETSDTVLDQGEVVYLDDELTEGSMTLRVGDGVTPGGRLVSNPFSLRVPYERLLRRSEYTILPWGNAIYSNGVWSLINDRWDSIMDAANTGGISIATSEYISRVTGDLHASCVYFEKDVKLNTRIDQAVHNLNYAAREIDVLPFIQSHFYCLISNLQVYAWVGQELLGRTNDARGAALLIDAPTSAASAIPLSWFNSTMAGRYAADWSSYSATSTVDLAWQPIQHNPYVSCFSADDAGSISWVRRVHGSSDRELWSIISTSACYRVFAFTVETTNVVLHVDASVPFASAPVIQYCTNLLSGTWTNLATLSDWPTSSWHTVSGARAWRAFTLSAIIPSTPTAFFRVSGAAAVAPQETSRTALPLTILEHCDTNAPPAGVKLYVYGNKLWAVSSETNRVCLTP